MCGLDLCDYTFCIADRKTDTCEHLCRKHPVSLFTHYFFEKGNFGLSLLFQNGATVPHLRKID